MKRKQVLITLPCAGGRAANYQIWAENLDCLQVGLDFPGHWDRWDEPLKENIEELSIDVANVVANMPLIKDEEYEFCILGHSMGCIVAWLASQILIEQFHLKPKGLILCAMVSPQYLKVLKSFAITSDKEIKGFLRSIRQVPDKLLKSDFFDKNLMPFIKADFRVFHNCCCEMRKYKSLPVPILTIEGEDDKLISSQYIEGWKELSSGYFHEKLPGDHFFLFDSQNVFDVCRLINNFWKEIS